LPPQRIRTGTAVSPSSIPFVIFTLMQTDRPRLRELVGRTVKRGTFTLASGETSDFYFDGRLVTLDQEGSLLVGAEAAALAGELRATALGGPATAACPIITAAGICARDAGLALKLFYVRSEPKKHGTRRLIEGPQLERADRVLVVDDVVTSGGSFLKAIEAVRLETGAVVVGAFALVDRLSGGREKLGAVGVDLRSVFTRADFGAAGG
jgi:orotate phosphoribosyltransferase